MSVIDLRENCMASRIARFAQTGRVLADDTGTSTSKNTGLKPTCRHVIPVRLSTKQITHPDHHGTADLPARLGHDSAICPGRTAISLRGGGDREDLPGNAARHLGGKNAPFGSAPRCMEISFHCTRGIHHCTHGLNDCSEKRGRAEAGKHAGERLNHRRMTLASQVPGNIACRPAAGSENLEKTGRVSGGRLCGEGFDRHVVHPGRGPAASDGRCSRKQHKPLKKISYKKENNDEKI